MTGVIGANDAGRGTCGVRPRPRFGWRAMERDRARVTSTTTPPSVAPTPNITVDVFLVGKPSSDVGPFERRD